MKAGQLVVLSAYAEKLKMFRTYRGKIGLLVAVKGRSPVGNYFIEWCGVSPWERSQCMQRKDIKKVN